MLDAANEIAYHKAVNGALERLRLIPSANNADPKSLLQTGREFFRATNSMLNMSLPVPMKIACHGPGRHAPASDCADAGAMAVPAHAETI